MKYDWIIKETKRIEQKIISHRRILHQFAEVGTSLAKTKEYVISVLQGLGYEAQTVGKCGVVALIKGAYENGSFKEAHRAPAFLSFTASTNLDETNCNKVTQKEKIFSKKGKNVILRADMDALPIEEETNLSFKSVNGHMHACGHDFHTSMLLGCAEILSRNKDKFNGNIKLIFQGAEETLQGAKDMIENGVLDSPPIDCGAMIHVLTGTNWDTGTAIFANHGVSAPSSDFFKITVKGKSTHGGMPEKGVDPSIPCAHIVLGLESLISHETEGNGGALLTIGEIHLGKAANVIAGEGIITGTMRAYKEDVRNLLKKRLVEIVEGYSKSHNAVGQVEFTSGCPTLLNDKELIETAEKELREAFSCIEQDFSAHVINAAEFSSRSYASEDFAYFSHEIPTVMLGICAGSINDGYTYPLHHPKTDFDEKSLFYGTIAYTTLGVAMSK